MTKPGQKQRVTVHKVAANVSPDERLRAEQRSDIEKHFGDPDYSRCHERPHRFGNLPIREA